MADAGYVPDKDGPKLPGNKKPGNKKPQDRTPAEKKADQKAKRDKKQRERAVANIVEAYSEEAGGKGAPVTAEFVEAALEAGLTPKDIRAILNTNVLSTGLGEAAGGTQNFSSAALVDFFTDNPENFGALLEAVKANAGAPQNYAEYLAGGGAVGGYRSADQLLQEALFGIEGAKEAYLSVTPYSRYIAEGNDPRRWYLDRDEFMNKNKPPAPSAGPSFQGGFDVPNAGYDALNEFGFGDVVSQMMAARQQRMNAQLAQGDVFDIGDMAGEE